MRAKATIKNSLWGFIQQAIICILSLVSRRVMLDSVGIDGVGLNGLLVNVVALLSLAEMGVGSVIIYHMYAPLAKGDQQEICRLMNFYKSVYRMIAGAITGIGLVMIPFLPYIVNGVHYTSGYVVIVYLLFLLQTVSSYFFSYKRSLLSADQKQYIITIIDLIFRILTAVGGIVVLLLTKELICYLVFMIAVGILNNLAVSVRVDHLYPYIKQSKETLTPERRKGIFKNVRDLFIGKLSWTITSSTDNILISALVGTVQVGMYSNYTIVINTLTNVMNQLSAAMSGSIGNLLVTESKEYVDTVLHRLLFVMFFIASFCSSCLFCLINPFVSLMFGADMILGLSIVTVCVLNFFLMTMRVPVWNMVSAAGLFRQDKYTSIAGSVINLIVSFVLGARIGMIGILIGTTCTYAIQYILKVILIYRSYLGKSCRRIFAWLGTYLLLVLLECGVAYWLCSFVSTGQVYVDFVLKGMISAFLPLAVNILLFFRTEPFQYLRSMVQKLFNKLKKAPAA